MSYILGCLFYQVANYFAFASFVLASYFAYIYLISDQTRQHGARIATRRPYQLNQGIALLEFHLERAKMQRNNENTSLDSQNVDQESPSGKNRIREETRPSPGNTEKPSLVLAIQRNPAQYWQYRIREETRHLDPAILKTDTQTQLSTGKVTDNWRPGLVPAKYQNTRHEALFSFGRRRFSFWKDVEVRRRRRKEAVRTAESSEVWTRTV